MFASGLNVAPDGREALGTVFCPERTAHLLLELCHAKVTVGGPQNRTCDFHHIRLQAGLDGLPTTEDAGLAGHLAADNWRGSDGF